MRSRVLSLVFCAVLMLSAVGVQAQGGLEVTRQAVVNTDAETLWGIVGGFGTPDHWHPLVVAAELTGDGTMAGDRRVLELGDVRQ